MARAETTTAVAGVLVPRLVGVGGNRLAVECAEVAAGGRGGTVARAGKLAWPFRWPFRRRFRVAFPIRPGASATIRHRFADRGGRVLPTSPRPIEVWS
jgi:hypothetical protein